MAFPSIAATSGGANSSSSTSYDLPLPSGIAAGHLLVAVVSGGNPRTINTPSGWTQLFNVSGVEAQLKGIYKVADGTEGSTVTVTTSSPCFLAGVTHRITGHASLYIEANSNSTGTTDTHPIGTLTPSWSQRDGLWIGVLGNRELESSASLFQFPFGAATFTRYAGPVDGDAGAVSTVYEQENIATNAGGSFVLSSGSTPGCTAHIGIGSALLASSGRIIMSD